MHSFRCLFLSCRLWKKDTENCALGKCFGPSHFMTTLIRHSELEWIYHTTRKNTFTPILFLSFSISKKPPNLGYFNIDHFWFKSILTRCAAVLSKCFRFDVDIKGVSFCMQSRWSSIPDRIGNFPFANVSFRQDNVKDFTYVRSSAILFFPSEVIRLDWL